MLPALESLTRAVYFDTYLSYLVSDDVITELDRSEQAVVDLFDQLTEASLDHRYAEGKWSVREVIQHIIDTELVFNYRALTLGRETNPSDLKGFEQDDYVEAAQHTLGKADLLGFFQSTRATTKFLYSTFNDAQLGHTGTASGHPAQVLTFFYVNAGHTLHHVKVIEDRYLN